MASALGTFIPSLDFLDNVVQDHTLEKEFLDSLYPATLYRAEAPQEEWKARQGDTLTETRAANLADVTDPLTPGQDPTPVQPEFEQWTITCTPFGSVLPVDMRGDFMAISNMVIRNMKTMGLNAGASIDRLARNKLFRAYLSGETMTTAAANSTSVPVASLNGFTHVMWNGDSNSSRAGVLVPVSAQTPKSITISGVGTRQVTAAVPDDQNFPLGSGTLTVTVAANFAANAMVRAADAPTILRPGGGSIDTLTAASALTFKQCRDAGARMALNGVPTMPDGTYHCHLDPRQASQLRGDNEFQRMIEGNPRDAGWTQGMIGKAQNMTFFENPRAPGPEVQSSGVMPGSLTTRGDALWSPQYYAEYRNASGVGVLNAIVLGGGSIYEKYVDEMAAYATAAGTTGKVGEFSVLSNNGIGISIERIRMILQAPLDVMQTVMKMAWSWAGDYAVPSDAGGGIKLESGGALYKRGVVLQSGCAD